MKESHQPVLLTEVISHLMIDEDGIYIDGTFGRGGHSQAILKALSKQGTLLAIDQDPKAIEASKEKIFAEDKRFHIVKDSFSNLQEIANTKNLLGKVSGILLDLGVSSPQLDNAERGFSFLKEGPLDMRMDTTQGMDASAWINTAKEADIAQVLKEYGEERFSKRIANAIVSARVETAISTTTQLAAIVTKANPKWEKHKHPATRSFQAIRIFINNELNALNQALMASIDVLKPGGRLAVISFHSLEDRIVKRFIREKERGKMFPKGLPVTEEAIGKQLKKIGKAIKSSSVEIEKNIRARSAILRIAEKI